MYAYITASTERTKKNIPLFKEILKISSGYGFKNTNDYLNSIINNKPNPDIDKKDFHIKVRKRIKKADLMIADISDASVTLGTLIEYAVTNNIKVLCLVDNRYKSDLPSIMRHYDSRYFALLEFNEDTLTSVLNEYFTNFKKAKIKLNVNVTTELDSYLNWYAKKYHVAKSDLIRNLIITKLKNDKDYKNILPSNTK